MKHVRVNNSACGAVRATSGLGPNDGLGLGRIEISVPAHTSQEVRSLHSSYLALAIDADGVARERCCLYVVCWQRMKHLR